MKSIALTHEAFALVDDADFADLNRFKWRVDPWGYVVRSAPHPSGKHWTTERMNRRILGLEIGDPTEGDHWNRNKLDNQRLNLRACTRLENAKNIAVRKDNRAGLKGVGFHKAAQKWVANITCNGVRKHLGCYASAEEAHEVYCLWADMLHGAFASHRG